MLKLRFSGKPAPVVWLVPELQRRGLLLSEDQPDVTHAMLARVGGCKGCCGKGGARLGRCTQSALLRGPAVHGMCGMLQATALQELKACMHVAAACQ